jgi:threonine dehydrogenase-like Zn-dependent dehydrogenase
VRALTVEPGTPGTARIEDRPAPVASAGHLEVSTVLVGVCGTDAEIVAGTYGTAPPGEDRLVVGHEAVGRVTGTVDGSGFARGDLVVPIVRRPDPEPCPACAVGEWDMCRNGGYTEHGIKGVDGFARETFDLDPRFAVAVPATLADLAVLVEPTSVVAKAWEQIDRIGRRAHWAPRRVLVTGAGPVGLLAALLARQRGYATDVLDRVTTGPKPDLVADLGAEYRTGSLTEACPPPDIVVECTGAGSLVLDAMRHTSPAGIVCLAGLSSGARVVDLDAAALNRRLVLENDVVFGTVNANRRHYDAAVAALAAADRGWLAAVVTRRVPLSGWADAFEKTDTDVKVALDLTVRGG